MWANIETSSSTNKSRQGFTIVELLIVIVVIGILAAITIVAYNGIQQRARISSVTSALAQSAKKLALYQVDNGSYPATGSLALAGVTDSQSVSYQYTGSASTFCLTATNGNVSYLSTAVSSPAPGGCPGHGQGGVAAITNLVADPNAEAGASAWTVGSWGTGGAGNKTVGSASGAYSGTSSFRMSWTSAATGGEPYTIVPVTSAAPGQAYTCSGYVKASFSANVQARIVFRDSATTWLTGGASGTAATATTDWSRRTVTATAPSTTVTALCIFAIRTDVQPPVGGTYDIDAVMATAGAVIPVYADGSSPNWTWNGTPNNSTSTGPPQ
jgi:prepilin-type N-terminal cleavage/methylation domain-containing protein